MTQTEAACKRMARSSGASIIDYLDDVQFPTNKGTLIEAARDNNAPEEVLDEIRALPDVQFRGPQDITAGARLPYEESGPAGRT